VVRNKILIIDDQVPVRFGVREFLTSQGYEVDEADSCREAERSFRTSNPDAAIIDYLLPDGNALDLLPRLKAISPEIPLIILTGHGSIDLAVRAIKEGAEQFLTKPVELPALLVVIQRLLDNQRNRQNQLLGKSLSSRQVFDPFIGTSFAIRKLAELARKSLMTESPVLIQGETGAGKGVLARWLHNNSRRGEEAFVDLNCAVFSRELLESELFGYEKGAFTSATTSKIGLLEAAHRGTVFLDEIGDVDQQVQPKLLKVLEDKRFRRLGDVRERMIDVRLIASTHQDLSRLAREKKFRSDLFFRINTLPLTVPPLRERAEDIPFLARDLLKRIADDLGRGEVTLSPELKKALMAYSWPGNIRELRNVLERAVLLSEKQALECEDVVWEGLPGVELSVQDASLTLVEVERRHIQSILRQEHWRVEEAARKLGLSRSALYEKIKKHQLSLSGFPESKS
jgi:DNA-binding NtrC family response regulator